MSKTEQIKTECNQCVYNDETCSMCDTCFLGTNFLSKSKMPLEVIMCMAMTADGMIAKHDLHQCSWTPKSDKKNFKRITKDAQVVIMGRKTYQTLATPLEGRLNIVMTRDTTKVSKYPHVIFTNQSPNVILHSLAKRNYKKVCVIGGAEINTAFIRKELVTKLCVTIVPKLFGTGISLTKNLDLDIDLAVQETDNIGDGCFAITYSLNYKTERESCLTQLKKEQDQNLGRS